MKTSQQNEKNLLRIYWTSKADLVEEEIQKLLKKDQNKAVPHRPDQLSLPF